MAKNFCPKYFVEYKNFEGKNEKIGRISKQSAERLKKSLKIEGGLLTARDIKIRRNNKC